MLNLRYVPDNFGKGITVTIPKGECRNVCNKCDDYRGITINPILSKLFEDCLLLRMHKYFETSSRQFGFKKGVGCLDAILNVKLASDHFTSNHSNVNICTIDVKKAFDSLNYNIIYNRLMDVHMPVCYIEILMCWYNKVFIVVKWQNVTSNFVKLKAGKAGGILSPYLFAISVDAVLLKLEKSKLGCFINYDCYNSFMYADDLILLSVSLLHLQLLVNLCQLEFHKLV
jgi:hypothetical protein